MTEKTTEKADSLTNIVVGIMGVCVVGCLGVAGNAVLEMRALAVRIEVLERTQLSMLQVGRELGDLNRQMSTVTKSIDELKVDLREARSRPK